MNFVSTFGINEICIVNNKESMRHAPGDGRNMSDHLVKVIAITFSNGMPEYHCEWFSSTGVLQRACFQENQLTGDPDFDQNAGKYKD